MTLYAEGRRRILPPVIFGLGVLWHLLRRGRYDVVHTASFPYFSLLAAAAARPLRRFRLVVDWHEVWTRAYWREYLGEAAGRVGWAIQLVCVRVPQQAFCFSRLHSGRLRELGLAGEVALLEGQYAGSLDRPEPEPAESFVVFAGRHIPEKRVTALVPAIKLAREDAPELRCQILGDGPERPRLLRLLEAERLEGVVDAPGFVQGERVERALRQALCLVLPSRREGYGLVVVEAAARGTPTVVVRDPDNAAAELVEDGQNGFVARSAAPRDLADSILAVRAAGAALRESTADWFERNAARLSLARSLEVVMSAYSAPRGAAER